MDTEKTAASDPLERLARGMLGLALMVGVAWSLTEDGALARWGLAGLGF